MHIQCTIAYDGTHYLGWQKTKEGPSIEEELEKALAQVLQENPSLQAASRTDRGVHAHGQVVDFFTQRTPDLDKLQKSVNALLPSDIRVLGMEYARKDFHPSLDAMAKEYRYEICTDSVLLPQRRHYVWHYPYTLSLEKMLLAKEAFLGEKEFASFCNIRRDDTLRHLQQIEIEEGPEKIYHFRLIGKSFLYKMVRTIVGTIVYVGKGKIGIEEIPRIFEAKNRTLAGMTAPAHGLTLFKVFYI